MVTSLPLSIAGKQAGPAARAALGSADGLWEWRVREDEVWLSESLRDMLGVPLARERVTLATFLTVVHADDTERVRKGLDRCCVMGCRFDADVRLRVGDHGFRWFRAAAAAFLNEEGEPHCVSGSLRDITDERDSAARLRSKEQRLMQHERMDALDCLAGGIAHEFNNVLQAVRGYLSFAMDELTDPSQVKNDLRQAMAATDRAVTLTRSLLDFARADEPTGNRCFIEDEVAGLESLLRPVIGEHIDLRTHVDEEPMASTVDAQGLRQSLLNLCINARDAMPEGGELVITAERFLVDNVTRAAAPDLPEGAYCRLRVSDSGVGIAGDVVDKIFDPFFSTKEVGRGTGLGLATVFGFLQRSGGAIRVHSEEDRGTAFNIYLPIEEPSGMDHHPDHPELLADGPRLVLLVEDDPQACEVGRRTLEGAGYRVLVAEDGEAALEAYAENLESVELVVLDVVLPKLSGRRVFEEIRRLQSDVPVVFVTGFDPRSAAGTSDGLLADTTLAKPYDRRQLLSAVKSLLADRPVAPAAST